MAIKRERPQSPQNGGSRCASQPCRIRIYAFIIDRLTAGVNRREKANIRKFGCILTKNLFRKPFAKPLHALQPLPKAFVPIPILLRLISEYVPKKLS
jgi:hypothetical protein